MEGYRGLFFFWLLLNLAHHTQIHAGGIVAHT